ncbi:lasso peptide biosynthesis B2 protein [Robertmurraya korlensis]|uniref:lasso peptide biosynthesis B2 protein n=1 Tax=Robertmurraya korlensis TaxID=519977 RepID=UPI000824EB93|nr:lasso peptide biosynthesis B2 protein [Robertmurraya korlensis]
MNIIKLFLVMDNRNKRLFFEAFIYLGWARYLKFLPFNQVLSRLGLVIGETSVNRKNQKKDLILISNAINIVSKYTFWESQCLVKALAGMKMLELRGIESTIYLGTAKDNNDRLIAHAWLRSGDIYISGQESMEKFTVVGKFAKKIIKHEGAQV